MDIETGLIALAIIGLIVLILAVFFSILNKNVVSGIMLIGWFVLFFLLLSPWIGGIGLLHWYSRTTPGNTQIVIGRFAFIVGLLSLNSFAQIDAYRIKNMGNILTSGTTGSAKTWRGVMWFFVSYSLLTMISDLFYGTNVNESIRRNTIWWVLAICLLIYLFFSFEIRDKGFVYRGKFFLFSDIEHAEWEDLRDKTKLKIHLKAEEPILENQSNWKRIIEKIKFRFRLNRRASVFTIKTPWEMNVQIDNYLRANFPRS